VLVVVALSGVSHGGDGTAAGRRPGMEAHVDPDSGELVPEPVTPRPAESLPAPLPPLAEEAAPGGGTMVRLNGQFMSNVVATVNPDGSVRIECVTEHGPHQHQPHAR
jgi:hypothetical protein